MNYEISSKLNDLISGFKELVNQDFCLGQKRDHAIDDLLGKMFSLKNKLGYGDSSLTDETHRVGPKNRRHSERVRSFSFVSQDKGIYILLEFTIVQGQAGKRRHKIIANFKGSDHTNTPVLS